MTDHDDEIRELLDRLAELAGDPSDLELRTAFAYFHEYRKQHDSTATRAHYRRLVARIEDAERRDVWCRHLANATGADIRSARRSVNEYR